MPSPKKREQLRAMCEAPVTDEASLLVLEEQAADYIRESKRRHSTEPDVLVSQMLRAVARDYFRHVQRKTLRRKSAS
jgi:hypothetical protein